MWAGKFGEEYTKRNKEYAGKKDFWQGFFWNGDGIDSVLEFGANTGLNLLSIKENYPFKHCVGVELNRYAYEELVGNSDVAICGNFLELNFGAVHDLVFTSGVLIHLKDNELPIAYTKMYDASRKYILIMEYFNPTPIEIPYRDGVYLHKRDFCKEIMAKYPDLDLIDYGFVYHLDGLDDINWFLLKKG